MNVTPDQISDGQLYKVRYENGMVAGLDLVRQMNQNAVPVLRNTDGRTSAGDEIETVGQGAPESSRNSGSAGMESAEDEDADEAA